MINNIRFSLTSKLEGNIGAIYATQPNGDSLDIAWFRFPNDHQVNDNIETINAIIPILRKRIKKSV